MYFINSSQHFLMIVLLFFGLKVFIANEKVKGNIDLLVLTEVILPICKMRQFLD